jgi:hypothetical protein
MGDSWTVPNRLSLPLLSKLQVRAIILLFLCVDVLLFVSYLLFFHFGLTLFAKAEPVILNLNTEGNIPSWYSAMKLLLVALCAYFLGRLIVLYDRAAGTFILLFASGFLYMSVDEGAALHEKLGSNIDKLLTFVDLPPVTGLWVAYLAPPLLFALIAGFTYLRKRLLVPPGIIVIGIAGLIILIAAAFSDMLFGTPLATPLQVAGEEFGEMLGVTLILWATMALLVQHDATIVARTTVQHGLRSAAVAKL